MAVMDEQSEQRLNISGVLYLVGDIFGEDGFFAANFEELCAAVESVLSSLSDQQHRVLELRYGLRDGHCRTLEEVGNEFGLSRERIRQCQAKALRRLRHPSRSRYLLATFAEGQVKQIIQQLIELKRIVTEYIQYVNGELLSIKLENQKANKAIAERLEALDGEGMTPVEELNLPEGLIRRLKGAGLFYVFQLLDEKALLRIRGIGEVTAAQIKVVIRELRGKGHGNKANIPGTKSSG